MPFLVIRILEYKHNENTSYSFVLLSKIKKRIVPIRGYNPFFRLSEPKAGLEPATCSLRMSYSTN